jgi:hypothetical protein
MRCTTSNSACCVSFWGQLCSFNVRTFGADANRCAARGPFWGLHMSDCFKVYGPFAIENKQRIVDREHQSSFWTECVDNKNFDLSFAKGIYLFSLKNADNYNPQYVGMTERDFRTEVFNDRNTVMIFKHFLEERGVLCLHLLAKPKPTHKKGSR